MCPYFNCDIKIEGFYNKRYYPYNKKNVIKFCKIMINKWYGVIRIYQNFDYL